ncbi:MAG: dihydrofolate reductase [Caldilineaceae bacterium SB0670_bin_27]|uniref:Dihydrofolate reductase n=1 Tax=Caldilineaceae bacterium SB0664_bin_27 TaxID=2605260 RepID=A0A6B0YTA7_9CHLR|nr:dihydrofolate reductase [Caldilineaceae bacterium SB0664_bin_27]MYJ78067.1 dihydrofolate reductase [Caldilineaceae bacterium SB0670_bin_27]
MRKVRYNCAMSLDGYIADSDDGFDWIAIDPDIDFEELSSQFDTYLMGRRTFEAAGRQGPPSSEVRNYVFSNTLKQSDHEDLRIISADWEQAVRDLRAEPGKDIWLFGGGVLFGNLCNEGLVDTLEVSVLPILLGGGVPLVAGLSRQADLILKEHKVFEKTGTALLVYDIDKTHHRRRV